MQKFKIKLTRKNGSEKTVAVYLDDTTARACKKFFKSFGADSELIERDFNHRLQEIEEEIERERKKKSSGGNGSGNGETK